MSPVCSRCPAQEACIQWLFPSYWAPGWGLGTGTDCGFAAKCSLIQPAHLLENNLIILEEQLAACQQGALKEGPTGPLEGDPIAQVNPERREGLHLQSAYPLATIGANPSWISMCVGGSGPTGPVRKLGLQGAWISHAVRQDVPRNVHNVVLSSQASWTRYQLGARDLSSPKDIWHPLGFLLNSEEGPRREMSGCGQGLEAQCWKEKVCVLRSLLGGP